MRKFGELSLLVVPAVLTVVVTLLALIFIPDRGLMIIPIVVLSVTTVWLVAIACVAVVSWMITRFHAWRARPHVSGDSVHHA